MSVLDMILVEEVVNTPTTVTTDFVSPAADMTYKEAAFAIQVNYSGGSNVNMNLFLEVSLDGINYAPIVDSVQNIADPSGTHIWDLIDSGTHYMRVGIEVTTGSINLDLITIQMRRRH